MAHNPIQTLLSRGPVRIVAAVVWDVAPDDLIWNEIGVLIENATSPNPNVTFGDPMFLPWHTITLITNVT